MKVKIEHCWGGGHTFRITLPDGSRESIRDPGGWDRKTASKVLDLLEHVYKLKRRSIRFDVR